MSISNFIKVKLALLLCIFNVSFTICQSIKTNKRILNDTVYFDFINHFHAPLEFSIEVQDSVKELIMVEKSVFIDRRSIKKNVLKIPLFLITDSTKIDLRQFIKFKGFFGDSKLGRPNLDYQYTFPFQNNKSYKLIQGFRGKFSHNKPHSRYALDFNMQIGDTITSARKGSVVFVKQDSKKYGGRKFIGYANKIIVLHEDGTFAHYVHLAYEKAFVEEGDNIEVGQPLGLVGMSGFTTTPHLHFVVMKNKSESIPIYFRGYGNKKLKINRNYKHK